MTEMPPDLAQAHLGPDQVPRERCSRPFIKRRSWARYCSTDCKDRHHKETAAANERDAALFRKHVAAVDAWMKELGPYLGLDGEGPYKPADFLDAAKRIREWCNERGHS